MMIDPDWGFMMNFFFFGKRKSGIENKREILDTKRQNNKIKLNNK